MNENVHLSFFLSLIKTKCHSSQKEIELAVTALVLAGQARFPKSLFHTLHLAPENGLVSSPGTICSSTGTILDVFVIIRNYFLLQNSG